MRDIEEIKKKGGKGGGIGLNEEKDDTINCRKGIVDQNNDLLDSACSARLLSCPYHLRHLE